MPPYTSQTKIPQGAGTAYAPMGMARFTGGQGLQEIGRAIGDIAAAQANIRISREVAEGMAAYNAQSEAFKLELSKKDPRDSDFLAEYDKLQPKLNSVYKKYSIAAQEELSRRFTTLNERNRSDVAYMALEREKQLVNDELPSMIENYAMNGQRDLWEKDIDALIERGVAVPAKKKVLLAEYDRVAAKMQLERSKELGYQSAVSILDNGGSIEDAIKAGKDFIPAQDRQEFESEIRTIDNYRKAAEKEAYDLTVEQVGQESIKRMTANDPTAIEFINNSSLKADDKIKWRDAVIKESERKARGEAIITNQVARYNLKTKALSIWQGNATKADFDKALNDARYGTNKDGKFVYALGDITSDTPLIDDKDYQSLADTAATEIKSRQADAISRTTRAAANVILGSKAGLIQTDEAGNVIGINMLGLNKDDTEDAKFRLNYVNQYEETVRDWLINNPDKSYKEFLQFAEGEKIRAWNSSIEDIKASSGKMAMPKTPDALPSPKTEAEYNELPSGTTYIHPDGTRKVKK